ncbi:hypothetical protein Daus18300_008153 [Diaporthe australafricana]|uniref:Uncharacterized protein n=1 Tax=Diaporthe australafricana TaxID=127596 RepID=A0ABR3WJ61_9PEZI
MPLSYAPGQQQPGVSSYGLDTEDTFRGDPTNVTSIPEPTGKARYSKPLETKQTNRGSPYLSTRTILGSKATVRAIRTTSEDDNGARDSSKYSDRFIPRSNPDSSGVPRRLQNAPRQSDT